MSSRRSRHQSPPTERLTHPPTWRHLAVGALLGLLSLASGATTPDDADVAKAVTTQPFAEVAVRLKRSAPATATSLNNAQISAQITGVINEITVRVGDTVEAGDPLVRIDCTIYVLKLEEAEGALERAQARDRFGRQQLKNARRLARNKSISEEEIDKRESEADATAAEVTRLEAAARSATDLVDKCLVKAPFSDSSLRLRNLTHGFSQT